MRSVVAGWSFTPRGGRYLLCLEGSFPPSKSPPSSHFSPLTPHTTCPSRRVAQLRRFVFPSSGPRSRVLGRPSRQNADLPRAAPAAAAPLPGRRPSPSRLGTQEAGLAPKQKAGSECLAPRFVEAREASGAASAPSRTVSHTQAAVGHGSPTPQRHSTPTPDPTPRPF